MVWFSLFFTLGVWYLQQQAALPVLPAYWPIAAALLLLPRQNGRLLVIARHAALLIGAALLGFCYAAWIAQHRLSDQLSAEWQGKNIVLTGIVAEMPRLHERGLRFQFDVESVQTVGAHVPRHIQLATYDGDSKEPLKMSAGQRWQLTVRLKQPHGSSNPYNFDFEAWALERNIRAIGYVYARGDNKMLSEQTSSPAYLVQRLRETIRTHFRKTLSDAPYTGVLTALAIGDQSGISQSDWQLFTRTGVNHLMSISGLHITMLAGLVFAAVYWLWRRSIRLTLWFPARKAAALAGILAALFYTLVSGFEVPAQRTLYMLVTIGLMLMLSRNVSPSQLLAYALMVVLLADPWAVLSPGFWLSFGAVALIFYVTANRLRRQHWLREYGKVQWAMMIGLIPPLLALFQQLSLVSPLANAFAIPLVSFIVVPLTLLGTLPPFEWMLYVAHEAMTLCMYLLHLLDKLPYVVWSQHAPPAWTILAGIGGALWLLSPRGFPMRWLGSLLLLPMFLVAPERPAAGGARLVVFDVGQGLSVAVQTHAHALLYDTGPDFSGEADSGNRILLPALRGMGILHLDTLVLSHDDVDHIGGTESVLSGIPVTNVISSLPDTHPKLQLAAHNEACFDGQSWEWDGVRFEMLSPAKLQTPLYPQHDNERSCILRISTGRHSVLLAGDAERLAESRLTRLHPQELRTTFLLVPHHGSKSSSSPAFVDAVHPRYAMFTAGYLNRFGHPKDEVVERYRAAGSEILRSDEDGAVDIRMDARDFRIERYRTTHARYWQQNRINSGAAEP
ncbi:DNA internalization-related competence protein ComEC/Rec2 [Sideroxydans lithotrophicus]|uniref:DNA internalization-related competence protein ComEC/Rec2 n=1 Tax=Sideroxydans lithotrophicus (strain ES-1) TaxID=580332 RepID=D5CRP7_SIDLE|nr:DNA internalization-related competence protein ComEC/Rec2 [Sideroxydans lithotrophicus]ADE11633.1 DNA internalization-related competence protein ComEC/Rec2 [Sideroxydans lithotrophicus ES-1]